MQMRSSSHVALAGRIRDVWRESYGPALAEELGLIADTWANYESGVVVPSSVILRFIAATGANPLRLLTGQGQRCRAGHPTQIRSPAAPPRRAVGP